MIESLVSIVLMGFCLYIYWRVRMKGWLVLALGFFLSTSNVVFNATFDLLLIFGYRPTYWVFDWADRMQFIVSATIIGIGLGLVLKGMWGKYRMKQKTVMQWLKAYWRHIPSRYSFLSILLLVAGIIAYDYSEARYFGLEGYLATHPYRDYAFPLLIFGAILFVVRIANFGNATNEGKL